MFTFPADSRSGSKAASPVSPCPRPGSGCGVSDGSAHFLPKQYSCTSNSSAYLSPQVRNPASFVSINTICSNEIVNFAEQLLLPGGYPHLPLLPRAVGHCDH